MRHFWRWKAAGDSGFSITGSLWLLSSWYSFRLFSWRWRISKGNPGARWCAMAALPWYYLPDCSELHTALTHSSGCSPTERGRTLPVMRKARWWRFLFRCRWRPLLSIIMRTGQSSKILNNKKVLNINKTENISEYMQILIVHMCIQKKIKDMKLKAKN